MGELKEATGFSLLNMVPGEITLYTIVTTVVASSRTLTANGWSLILPRPCLLILGRCAGVFFLPVFGSVVCIYELLIAGCPHASAKQS